MEAVTTVARAWRPAEIDPAKSTKAITLPPNSVPTGFASFGIASSEYWAWVSRTNWPPANSGAPGE
jgi:hypothetical protein